MFNNYTPRPNNDLLRVYGFIEDDNKKNNVPLRISLELDDPDYDLKVSELNKANIMSFDYPYNNNDMFVEAGNIPMNMIGFLRIKHFTPQDGHRENKFLPPPDKKMSDENEMKVLKDLKKIILDALARYPTTFEVSFS